jgi:hypothetical protein
MGRAGGRPLGNIANLTGMGLPNAPPLIVSRTQSERMVQKGSEQGT